MNLVSASLEIIQWESTIIPDAGWVDVQNAVPHEDHTIVTVGWVLEEDEEKIIISSTFGGSSVYDMDECNAPQTIKKALISDRRAIRVGGAGAAS